MPNQPDVLILMTDQHNPHCLGYAGDPIVQTPNIDHLAAEGMAFDNAYTVCPVCMPARGCFISGLYPHNHLLWRNYTDKTFPEELAVMFRDIRNAGYYTAQIGKGHYFNPGWGEDFEDYADYYHNIGFDYFEETTGPYMTPFHKANYTRHLNERGLMDAYQKDLALRFEQGQYIVRPSPLPPDDHNDAFIGRRAVEFIQNTPKDQPICLFVSFPGPHSPLDAPGEYATMYNPDDIDLPPNVVEVTQKNDTTDLDGLRQMRANYYGKITLIDDWIGKIVQAMANRGTWANTLSFFLADHGEHMGAHGKLGKGQFYKESGGIPLIIRWPDRVQSGKHTSALAEHIDVGATILDAIGGSRTEGHYGISLLPVATGERDVVHDAVFSEIGSGPNKYRHMVCTNRYKWWIDNNREYLFDLEEDPWEMNNIAGEHVERCKQMRERLLEFYLATPFDRARDYQPLFTRAGLASDQTDIADKLYEMFKKFTG
jgi:arylsulfatase